MVYYTMPLRMDKCVKTEVRKGGGKKQKSKCYDNILGKSVPPMKDMNEDEEKKNIYNEKTKCNQIEEILEENNLENKDDVRVKMNRAMQEMDKNIAEKRRLKNKKLMEGFEKEEQKPNICDNKNTYERFDPKAKHLKNLEIKSQYKNRTNHHSNQECPIKTENMSTETQEDNRSKERTQSYQRSSSCEETPLKELIMVAVENDCEDVRTAPVENEEEETSYDEVEDKNSDDSLEYSKDLNLDLPDNCQRDTERICSPTDEDPSSKQFTSMGGTLMLSLEISSKETFQMQQEKSYAPGDIIKKQEINKIQKDLTESEDIYSDDIEDEDFATDDEQKKMLENEEPYNEKICSKERCNENEEKEIDTVDVTESIVSLRDTKSSTGLLEKIEADAISLTEAVQDLFSQIKEMKITLFQCTDLLHNLDPMEWPMPKIKGQSHTYMIPVAERVNHCKIRELTQSQTLAAEHVKGDNPHHQLQDADSDGNSGKRTGDRNRNNKENSRRDEDEKDIDEQEHPPEDRNNNRKSNYSSDDDQASGEDHETDMESSNPLANHKYRRKYGLEDSQLAELLGKLANLEEAIPPDILKEVNVCLVECLTTKRSDGIEKLNACNVCSCLLSLLSHFGACLMEYEQCSTCLKSFNMIQYHLKSCSMAKEFETCPVVLCQKIQTKIRHNLDMSKDLKLWHRLKKYLARFSGRVTPGGDPGGEFSSMDFPSFSSMSTSSMRSIGSLRGSNAVSQRIQRLSTSQRPSIGFLPSLGIIPESSSFGSTYPTGRQSRSAPLISKNKNTGEVIYSKEAENLPSRLRPSRLSFANEPVRKISSPRQPRVSFAEVPLVKEEPSKPEEAPELVKELEDLDVKIPFSGKIYGIQGTHSMPIGAHPPEIYEEQLLSFNDQATGTPGIGEVVYGTRDQLLIVVKHWSQLQMSQGHLKGRHIREEGVILSDYKEHFELFGTRYQKNFQWIRLTHLGSGMSGKCHLATDYNTRHKFCIKKIYLVKYEKQELEIWSELSHPNIVQLYGAIRRDMKIYIFAEFIDGGCLTKTINDHKEMHQRLSHKMALCYLKQLLEVLVYLEKKSIIHEDIKGDNILLRKGTTEIAVTDFGVASRVIQQRSRGKSPVGTPTHFSPEKAESKGHGPKSDVWSAICVLIHMLSGSPPWIRRYKNVNTLNYIIVSKEAPVDDLPRNIKKEVRDLVEYGFNKDPTSRPKPTELLQHPAFKLLDEFNHSDTTISILPSFDLTSIRRNVEPLSIPVITSHGEGGSIQASTNTIPGTEDKFQKPNDFIVQPNEVSVISPDKKSSLLSSAALPENSYVNADYQELGVSFPPSKPAYIQEDPMKYILKYWNDDWCGMLPARKENLIVNPVYRTQLYSPSPVPKISDSEENIDSKIQRITERNHSNEVTPLPNFDILLESVGEAVTAPKPPQAIPSEVQDLFNNALQEGLQNPNENTSSSGSVKRFDSGQYEEELMKLREQLQVGTPEIMDILDFQMQDLLNGAGSENSNSTESMSHDKEQSRTITYPESNANKQSDSSENTLREAQQSVISTVSPLEEREVTPEKQERLKNDDHKDDTVINNMSQIDSDEESCKSDDMFGEGQMSQSSSPTAYDYGQAVREGDKIIINKSSGAIPKGSNSIAKQSSLVQEGTIKNTTSHSYKKSLSQPASTSSPPQQQNMRISHSQPVLSLKLPQQQLVHSHSQQFIGNQSGPEGSWDQLNASHTQYFDHQHQTFQPTNAMEYVNFQRHQSSKDPALNRPYPCQTERSKKVSPILPKLDITVKLPQNRSRNMSETQLKPSAGLGSSPMSAPVTMLQYIPTRQQSSGANTTSPDRRGSFNSQIDQKDEEIRELFRDISQHSETSHENSILEDLEDIHPIKTVEEEKENAYESILQQYVDQEETNNNNGVLLSIVREGQILFEMKLVGEHLRELWRTILEREIIDKIHAEGFKKFTLKNKNNQYLNLDAKPEIGQEILEIVDVCDASPWYCEASIFFS